MHRINISFDTSCVISLLELPGENVPLEELSALKTLWDMKQKGRVELFISEKTRTEVEQNISTAKEQDSENAERIQKWKLAEQALSEYKITVGRWIIGLSKLGIDTTLGSTEEGKVFDEMKQLFMRDKKREMKIGDAFDFSIIFEHYIQKNDIFVTRDYKNGILDHNEELKEKWGIIALNPIDALVYINNFS